MDRNKRTEGPASGRRGDNSLGREFNVTPYDETEPERIRELERQSRTTPSDEDDFVTDAELEARELDLPLDED
jgi:hypothetical protein